METVFICSVVIYRCEKSSSIKINMNLTQNFDMPHSDMYHNIFYVYKVSYLFLIPYSIRNKDRLLIPYSSE